MVLSTIAGVVTVDLLAKELKEPVQKALGWLFNKAKEKGLESYDEHKLSQALDNISDKITKVTKVKTIYKGDEAIDLHDFYVPTRIDGRGTSINCIHDISKDRAIVLEGTVGQGKSIFMRFLTYQEAKQGERIPLFFELRRLEDKQSLTNALSQQISNWVAEYIDRDFGESDFETVAQSNGLVLFLDGFDEVPHDRVKPLLNEIEGWCERYPNLQIVISSRPQADIQYSNYFKVFKLSKYRFYEQSSLIDKLVEEQESKELLKQAIKESSTEIQELLKTPLMVTLFVMNYRGSLEIPSNQYEFYKDLFSVLITRHDKTKPGYERELNSNLSKKELQEVFEQFCFVSLKKDKLIFDYTEAIEIIDTCLKKQGLDSSSSDNILEDFSKVVCLLLKDGREYSFIHKSIPEYFYACYIANKPESIKKKFYDKYISEDGVYFRHKVKNVLNFLKNNDEYCYTKYFLKVLVDEIINYYNIQTESNSFIKSVYLVESNLLSAKSIFIEYKDQYPLYEHYNFKKSILNIVPDLIWDFLKLEQSSYGFSFGTTSNEKFYKLKPIEELLNSEDIIVINEKFSTYSVEILNEKQKIDQFLKIQDSIDLDFE